MRYAKIRFSDIERRDLLKAWLATSVTFALFFVAGKIAQTSFSEFLMLVLIAAITAGLGFVGHELAHKFTANHFGVQAEFRSHDSMLVLSMVIAIFGLIIAAPGAVHILGQITRRENGIISAAGPAANLVLCGVFAPLMLVPSLSAIGQYGFVINALLGAFNMIPILDFDGVKILAWNKAVYFVMLAIAGILVVAAFI